MDGYGAEALTVAACDAPEGYVAGDPGLDCNDADAAIHPGADEADCADATDYNCDGSSAFADADADGWAACEECDDAVATVNPDAVEVCDDIDNDCSGTTDDDDPGLDASTATAWYADVDLDTYGDAADNAIACDAPSGYVADATDCDDEDAAWHPDAEELDCSDPNDYNCDGSVSWADNDADSFPACEECDDSDAAVNPDALEICDDIDNDCNSATDDADAGLDASTGSAWYADTDRDGYGDATVSAMACDKPSGSVADATDCDDTNGDINTGGIEVCDGLDNNCDSAVDDADAALDLSSATTWYEDTDGDSYGNTDVTAVACEVPAGFVSDPGDCDDEHEDVNGDAAEICDGIDNDCNEAVDDADAGLDASTATTWYADADEDTYGDAAVGALACEAPSGYVSGSTDCDDSDVDVNTAATEVCDAIDNNCDGAIDDDDASLDTSTATTWYADGDADGFGDPAVDALACAMPAGYAAGNSDCDDVDGAVNSDAIEVCDDVDNDCNGAADDDDAALDVSTATTWYTDSDADGYGVSTGSTEACDVPSGYAANTTDCDDALFVRNPGATEACTNAIDEDCDGSYSEGCGSTYQSCGGSSAMDVGNTYSCDLGSTVPVDSIYISVGCNDGETASYTVTFDDGSSTSVTGSCGSTHSITQRLTRTMTLYMSSGGGGDQHISFTCCGSSGWGMYYR